MRKQNERSDSNHIHGPGNEQQSYGDRVVQRHLQYNQFIGLLAIWKPRDTRHSAKWYRVRVGCGVGDDRPAFPTLFLNVSWSHGVSKLS